MAEPVAEGVSSALASASLSRSDAPRPPSRPPRRAPRTGTPSTPTTPTTPLNSTAEPGAPAAPLRLFFDWDETITAADTLSLIAPPEGEQLHGPAFGHYTEAYLADLSEFESSFGTRTDWERQLEFLGAIDTVEVASVSRVEQGGLFRGMPKSALLERATKVQFRAGWDAFAHWLHAETEARTVSADVISVGWSAEFIRHAIASRENGKDTIRNVYANEVQFDESNEGTGTLTKSAPLNALDTPSNGKGGIRTALHKLHILRSLTDSNAERSKEKAVSVYVGDSTTDLPCLLAAHYGLIMKNSDAWPDSSLNKTIESTNPPLKALYTGCEAFLKLRADEIPRKDDSETAGVLIRVDDWTQALAVVKHIQSHSAPTSS